MLIIYASASASFQQQLSTTQQNMAFCCSEEQEIIELSELCCAYKIIKRKAPGEYVPIKIACKPFTSSLQFYLQLERVTRAWQKLIHHASRDSSFIYKVYEQIAESDPIIKNNLKIHKLKGYGSDDDSFTFARCDYFLNEENKAKIIEYNLASVSLSAHSQNFQHIKRLSDQKNQKQYLENKPNERFTSEVAELYRKKQLKGLFVFLVSKGEANIVQHRLIEIKLIEKGVRCKRLTLVEAGTKLRTDENNQLRLGDQLVSVVYYRTGYQLQDFQENEELSWKAKQLIQLSNALKIPSVTMDLMNQKRMQVELSKPSIYQKYLEGDDVDMLKSSLVGVWEFDHLTPEEFARLLQKIEQNPTGFVLKPNLEGGGHNIYGERVLETLKSVSEQLRKQFILMERIKTASTENILIDGLKYCHTKTINEISQYGLILSENGKLEKNETIGFLIRIKPSDVDEGGVMAGVGSICSWKVNECCCPND